jgi:TolA-binding protein
VAVGVARAQEAARPLNAPVPLAAARAPAAVSAGAGVLSVASAQRAQELGLPAVAANLYRQLLASPAAGVDRAALTLALATALLDDGQAVEAEKILNEWVGLRGSAWHLRAGLAAAQLKKIDAAKLEVAAIKEGELSAADRGWFYFLQGALFDLATVQDITKANEFYLKAENAATTDLARARFQLAAEEVRLRLAAPTPAQLDATKKNYDQFQGRAPGYDFARSYAVMLDMSGKKPEAVKFLQGVLLMLPPTERARWDDFRFLLGLIANRGRDVEGRTALIQLLETGSNADKQREAAQLLAAASRTEPARGQFRAELRKLIDAKTPHPVLESLLLFSAQAALADRDYRQAEDDANELLKRFPGSALRTYALGVKASSAWEQGRYRLAATNARQARTELAAGADFADARAKLGVLEAEAWFRAGDPDDFRNAADAYAAVLRERPAGVPAGELMFQRVLAEIKSGSANAAQVLDDVEADAAFDSENRWQAEWNLARELQTRGGDGVKQAYARVNKLLGTAPTDPAIKPDLRARMAWLQARLSFEAGEPERTLALADGLAKQAGEVDAKMRDEIASTGALLKAQAQFALRDEARGLESLKKLRGEFPKSDAAVSSYLFEADYYAAPGRDRIVDAQKLLTKLADDFSDNAYAPYALFQAATLAERLGQDDNYREANRLIVELVKKYPANELVFWALLKEGELLEKLNQLPQAQQIYQEIENKFPRHKDVVRAQLALAECLNAQAAGNPSYLATAQAKFEQLRDRADAPIEVRVEAGYNLGELVLRRESPERAVEVWWRDVVHAFLLDDAAGKARLLDEKSKGRYWMARTLVRTGDVLEQLGKPEDAKRAWSLILEAKLGYESLARARLARFGIPEAKP